MTKPWPIEEDMLADRRAVRGRGGYWKYPFTSGRGPAAGLLQRIETASAALKDTTRFARVCPR